ncbi:MAG: hypothetical protein V1494_06555 [Candidatus Diapherotrites archaeon]
MLRKTAPPKRDGRGRYGLHIGDVYYDPKPSIIAKNLGLSKAVHVFTLFEVRQRLFNKLKKEGIPEPERIANDRIGYPRHISNGLAASEVNTLLGAMKKLRGQLDRSEVNALIQDFLKKNESKLPSEISLERMDLDRLILIWTKRLKLKK